MGKEKRRQERLDANLFVQFHAVTTGDDVGRGVVVDVSLSGFAVDTELDLEINDQLDCHIEVPLQLRAMVVRSIRQGQVKRYGLRFLGQGLLDKFLLKKILKGNRKTKKI